MTKNKLNEISNKGRQALAELDQNEGFNWAVGDKKLLKTSIIIDENDQMLLTWPPKVKPLFTKKIFTKWFIYVFLTQSIQQHISVYNNLSTKNDSKTIKKVNNKIE